MHAPSAATPERPDPPEPPPTPSDLRPGSSHTEVGRRRWLRPRLLAGALILVLLAGILVPSGIYARSLYDQARGTQGRLTAELSAAQADLTRSKGVLARGASDRNPNDLTTSRELNTSARRHFQAAQDIARTDPLLRQAAQYPYLRDYVSPRVQAVVALSDMGLAISDTIEQATVIDSSLIAPDNTGGTGGAKLIALLKGSQPQIDKLKADLLRARAAVAAVPVAVLTASQRTSLASAKETIDKGLAGVAGLEQLEPGLYEILGANGPRTYLVEQVNPAELRAGGGFIGSYAVIQTNGGNIKEVKSGGIESIDSYRPKKGQRGYVAPPDTLREFLGTDSWYLGDSNFFPDFPSNARAATTFAQTQLNIKVDGVLSLDPTAVGYLLDITGPVSVPGYNLTVQGSNFSQWLFEYENGPNRQAGRKAFLGIVADALLTKITALPATGWPPLVTAMNRAGQERHLQAYFNNDQAQQLMLQYRWADDLNPAKAPDFIAENESNFGGTKANQYVQRTYDLALAETGGVLHHHLDETITVDVTKATVIPQDWFNYRAYVRIYVPGSATKLSLQPVKADDFPNTAPPDLKLMDGWLQINVPRTTKVASWKLTAEWDTPWTPDPAAKSEALYWQKQPGTVADTINVTWMAGGRTFKASDKLLEDRLLTLGESGLTLARANTTGAALPSISL